MTGHGEVHPELAEVDGLFRVAVRDVDLGVVGGLQAGLQVGPGEAFR
ncbi:hypothetical protein [Streptomyces sp. NPDC057199]